MNNSWNDLYQSTSADHVNSGHVMVMVPMPERARVGLRAGYLMNTGWRPSQALTRAVDEWRKGHTSSW